MERLRQDEKLRVQELAGRKALDQRLVHLKLGSGGVRKETAVAGQLMTEGEIVRVAATA